MTSSGKEHATISAVRCELEIPCGDIKFVKISPEMTEHVRRRELRPVMFIILPQIRETIHKMKNLCPYSLVIN